jgi:hypothetical protein
MAISVPQIVNIVFSWLIVVLAIAGYILTSRRMGQKWAFWIILAIGWAFFAVCNTLVMLDINIAFLYGVWLSSYVLLMASLILLFLKLMQLLEKH